MRHIAIECPKCQTKGQVRIDELDLTYRCKRCRVQFHIGKGGRCILGPARLADEAEFASETRPAGPKFDPLGPLIEWVSGISYSARVVVAGLLVIGLALGLFGLLTRGGGEPIPESLTDRTTYLARAFVDGDVTRVETIIAPGTLRSVQTWFNEARPEHWADRHAGKDVRVDAKVVFQNARTGAACVVASLFLDSGETRTVEDPKAPAVETRPAKGAVAGSVPIGEDLLLFWTLDDKGLWLLNGDRTLRGS